MDASPAAEELRKSQQPLKNRYRENPDAGLITLEADVLRDPSGLS